MTAAHHDADPVFPAEMLHDWSVGIFVGCGMPQHEAETAADMLIRTSLRGYDSHGVTRVPSMQAA